MIEPIDGNSIDGDYNCSVLVKEVYLTGYWYLHEAMTGPKPKLDFQEIKDFDCNHMSICGYDRKNCPVKKAMEAL